MRKNRNRGARKGVGAAVKAPPEFAEPRIVATKARTRRYLSFVNELRAALAGNHTDQFAVLLDGRAASRCLELVSDRQVKLLGAHFTPQQMSQTVANALTCENWEEAILFDPACGSGDLLLAVARRLRVARTASKTLTHWNNRLRGCDLSGEFIAAARLRLLILAVSLGAVLDGKPEDLASLLTNIKVSDGLTETAFYQTATHIVMNPPYGRVTLRKPLSWRQGVVTAAALFVDRAASLARENTQIAALLPEVLRSGSSYASWRRHIAAKTSLLRRSSQGMFSKHADVDVFVHTMVKREKGSRIKPAGLGKRILIGSKFEISVGAVVPHRDPKSGPVVPYLHTKNAPPWARVRRVKDRKQFSGRLCVGPFVIIRRTSSPGDRYRAVASLIERKGEIAVENHLLVAKPKRGGIPVCEKLFRALKHSRINSALNRKLRCRHLTVGSITSLPWS